jgi:hypothetical protein
MDGQTSPQSSERNKVIYGMHSNYIFQMTSMMILANLFNSSSGRNPVYSATVACNAATALIKELEKRGKL